MRTAAPSPQYLGGGAASLRSVCGHFRCGALAPPQAHDEPPVRVLTASSRVPDTDVGSLHRPPTLFVRAVSTADVRCLASDEWQVQRWHRAKPRAMSTQKRVPGRIRRRVPPEAWAPLQAFARRARGPLDRFLEIEAASGLLLIAVAALIYLIAVLIGRQASRRAPQSVTVD